MADKTANVRLDLKAAGFRRGLKQTERDATQTGSRMGQAMSSGMNRGAKAGLDAARSMFSTIKTAAMGLGAIVGSVGLAGMVREAIDADKQFRKLAFTMGAGAGKFRDYTAIQGQAQEAAKRWAMDSTKLGAALDTVFNTVGDADFAMNTLDAIAMTARATGEEVSTLAPIVAEMNRQFGLTSEQIDDVLPMVISLGSRGGLSVADLGVTLGKLGRTAKVSGLEGEQGLGTLLAMVNQISAASGTAEGSVEKLQIIFTKLASGQGAAFLQTLKDSKGQAIFGTEVEGLDTLERLSLVLDKARANPRILQQVFGEQGLFIEQAFGGLGDVGKAMREASKSGLKAADMQDAAEANLRSASAGIDAALEELRQAFADPAMMSAIESLAENLPALAEGMAKIVDFVVQNPALAIGGAGAASALKGGIVTAITGAMASGGATAGGAIGTSMTAAGQTAGASIAGQMVGAASTAAATIGVALAVNQAQKLERDKKQARQDADDERTNLLNTANAQGRSTATRVFNPIADAIARKGFMGLTPKDIFGGDEAKEIIDRDAQGNIRTRRVSDTGEGPVSVPFKGREIEVDMPSDEELAANRKRMQAEWDAENARIRAELEESNKPITPAASAQQQSANARAAADAIAGKTLNVRVTNTVATRDGGRPGSAGTPPAPGYVPR